MYTAGAFLAAHKGAVAFITYTDDAFSDEPHTADNLKASLAKVNVAFFTSSAIFDSLSGKAYHDVDVEKKLIEELQVKKTPTLILLTPSGRRLPIILSEFDRWTRTGYPDPDSL
jgi:hypothetical protein